MKIENDEYLVIEENDKIKKNKIFSSTYPTLLGTNNFKKQGDAILEMWGLVPKSEFDDFYALRGYYAELIIKNLFDKKNYNYKYYGYDSSGNKIFDMFKSNKFFGGVVDFIINDYINVEVKSSNIDKKVFIDSTKGKMEHKKQAQLSSFLGSFNKAKLVYVYFTDEQEEQIRKELETGVQEFNIDNFDYHNISIHDLILNIDQIKKDMLIAYDFVKKCEMNKKIPLVTISDNVLEKLGFKVKNDIFKQEKVNYD